MLLLITLILFVAANALPRQDNNSFSRLRRQYNFAMIVLINVTLLIMALRRLAKY